MNLKAFLLLSLILFCVATLPAQAMPAPVDSFSDVDDYANTEINPVYGIHYTIPTPTIFSVEVGGEFVEISNSNFYAQSASQYLATADLITTLKFPPNSVTTAYISEEPDAQILAWCGLYDKQAASRVKIYTLAAGYAKTGQNTHEAICRYFINKMDSGSWEDYYANELPATLKILSATPGNENDITAKAASEILRVLFPQLE